MRRTLLNSTQTAVVVNPLTDAYVAYSLKDLGFGATNVIRVRRSSDNTEQDFTATEVTDGTLTTFCGGADGFVSIWYDQKNGHNLQGLNAARQPTIVDSGSLITTTNGDVCVQGNGIDQYLSTGVLSLPTFGDLAYSRFTAYEIVTTGAINTSELTLLPATAEAGARRTVYSGADSGVIVSERYEGGNTIFNHTKQNKLEQHTRIYAGGGVNVNAFVDGNALSVSSASMNPLNIQQDSGFGMFIGGLTNVNASGSPNYSDHKISEAILFLSDKTSERVAIENNIMTRWGI
jgi:hypothetical protein